MVQITPEEVMARRLAKVSPPERPREAFVYRLWNEAGELLYIGVTFNLFSRPWTHASQKAWGHEVRRNTFQEYPNKQAALVAEREAIIREKPKYNKRMTYATRLSDDQAVQLHRALDIAWAEIQKTDIDPKLGNLVIQEAKNRVLRAFRQ